MRSTLFAITQDVFGQWFVLKTQVKNDQAQVQPIAGPFNTPEEALSVLPQEAR